MKFGVREICDVVYKAKSKTKLGTHVYNAGEPVLYIDTAKTSSMEQGAATSYATGGRGNAQLIAWEGEKTVKFTVEDALISPIGLAILSGAELIKANDNNTIHAHTVEDVEVVTAGTITVTEMPSNHANAVMYIMLLDGAGVMSGVPMKVGTSGITVNGKDINCPLAKAGDVFKVDYYVDYATDAQEIVITPDKFAGFYYMEASTLFRREDGTDLPAEFVIPKVKIQSNFTFTMAATGDPSSFSFVMDAFPDYTHFDKTRKVLAAIQILKADDNYDLTGGGTGDDNGEVVYERYTYDEDGGDFITPQHETSESVTSDTLFKPSNPTPPADPTP